MKKKVRELCAILRKTEKELEKIRAACPHKKEKIGLWMDSPGRINPARICLDCGDNLGPAEGDWFEDIG